MRCAVQVKRLPLLAAPVRLGRACRTSPGPARKAAPTTSYHGTRRRARAPEALAQYAMRACTALTAYAHTRFYRVLNHRTPYPRTRRTHPPTQYAGRVQHLSRTLLTPPQAHSHTSGPPFARSPLAAHFAHFVDNPDRSGSEPSVFRTALPERGFALKSRAREKTCVTASARGGSRPSCFYLCSQEDRTRTRLSVLRSTPCLLRIDRSSKRCGSRSWQSCVGAT